MVVGIGFFMVIISSFFLLVFQGENGKRIIFPFIFVFCGLGMIVGGTLHSYYEYTQSMKKPVKNVIVEVSFIDGYSERFSYSYHYNFDIYKSVDRGSYFVTVVADRERYYHMGGIRYRLLKKE